MTVSQVWLRHLSQTFKSHLVSHDANCSQDAMSVKRDPQTVSEWLETPRSSLENTHFFSPFFFFLKRDAFFWKQEKEKLVGDTGSRKRSKDGLDKERETAVKGAAVLDVIGFFQLGLGEPVRRWQGKRHRGKVFQPLETAEIYPCNPLSMDRAGAHLTPALSHLVGGGLMTGALAQLERTITPLPSVPQVSSCWMGCSRLKVFVSDQPPGQETARLYQAHRDKMRTFFFGTGEIFSQCATCASDMTILVLLCAAYAAFYCMLRSLLLLPIFSSQINWIFNVCSCICFLNQLLKYLQFFFRLIALPLPLVFFPSTSW